MILEKREFYSVVQACSRLRIVEYNLRKLAEKGMLKIEKIKGRNWVEKEVIENYIRENGVIGRSTKRIYYPRT